VANGEGSAADPRWNIATMRCGLPNLLDVFAAAAAMPRPCRAAAAIAMSRAAHAHMPLCSWARADQPSCRR